MARVGDAASVTKTIAEEDLALYAKVSLDTNPVHFDEAVAQRTRFGGRVAHGMISAGLISAVIGTKLPGPGAMYLGQTLKFLAPVRIGDTITATATVKAVREDKPILTLDTVCVNQRGERVLEGEAVVRFDPIV